MSKVERIFYFTVILVMFALVMLFQFRLRDARRQTAKNIKKTTQQTQHLFSFEGESPMGEKTFVHFNAYSPNYYIILNTSADCPHCLSMLQDLQSFNPEIKLPENVFIYLITTDEFPEPLPPPDSPINVLKIAFDDWYQFGMETPSGKAANGKGEIIAHWKGYSPKVLETALQAIQNYNNTNTKSIRINSEQ